MAVLGLCFCPRAFPSCGKWGPLFIAVRGPLIEWPLLLRSTGSRRAGSVIVAHGPSCSVACGIFPDQGSNPCRLHWQADSQPLRHQGSPPYIFLWLCIVFSLIAGTKALDIIFQCLRPYRVLIWLRILHFHFSLKQKVHISFCTLLFSVTIA